MAVSAEQIQELADAVAMWRMEEYLYTSFFCLYVYYVLTTLAEEVSIILPQKWGRGKMLYMTIRYGLVIYIALQFVSDYRNYFSIPPNACKALWLIYNVIRYSISLACDFLLALCLGAVLQSKLLYLVATVILSCGIPFVNAVLSLASSFQYPAEPVSPIDAELGYPCYAVSIEQLSEQTIGWVGRDIRAYANLVATTVLTLLGIVTLLRRYKDQDGRLVQVVRRDGGIHYLTLLAIRMTGAVTQTPSVMSLSELDSSSVITLVAMANAVVIPILAQRLLINMRKVDYMGSEPLASKLLFAPPAPGSEDDVEGDADSFEMAGEPSGLHRRGAGGEGSEVREERQGSNNA